MIIASIDLMDGKAVQLRQGREKVLEVDEPLALAERFGRFSEIAVIDLDQALERGENRGLIRKLVSMTECRVGGGIRSVEKARELISWGAGKVIVGSKAFEERQVNHAFLRDLRESLGRERVIVAVDTLGDEIVTRGWTFRTGLDLFRTAGELEPYCSELLFTSVEREGMMQGSDRERIRRLKLCTGLKITAAGGVSTLSEVAELAGEGIDVQLGMALYNGSIDLGEGFIGSLKWKEKLLPVITRDEKGNVLMLAYANEISLRQTFATGMMHYYSRSRNALWMKGETSGNTQSLIRLRADCDRDAILATVKQRGPACHTGSYSCFGSKPFTLFDLEEVIQARLSSPNTASYTSSLTLEQVKEKLLEEAAEVTETESEAEVIWEAADVLYFLLVYMAKKGVSLSDVLWELRRRREK